MFRSIIFRNKSELQQEKQKDYRNIVLIQIAIIVFGLALSEVILNSSQTPGGKLVTTLYLCFGGVYSFLQWDLLRNFTQNRLLINSILIILLGVFLVGTMGEFPYCKVLEFQNRQHFLFILHATLFPIEVIVISYAMRDIFSGDYLTPDKLWGAAGIFLMIGITFGSLYHLICLIKPESFGESIEIGLSNYSESVRYSMSILGGLDPGFPNASRIIKNIGVFEAVWSNLFVVLIIGKLMTLPRPPKPEEKQTT